MAWERGVDAATSGFINPAPKVFNAIIHPDIVVQCRKLYKLAKECDAAINAHVLMAYYGLGDSFGLISATSEDLEHLHGLDTSVDIKGHFRRGEISLCCPNVVQKAC